MQMHVMSTETLYMSTFLMGLFGGTHCAGMCGGIVPAGVVRIGELVRQGFVYIRP